MWPTAQAYLTHEEEERLAEELQRELGETRRPIRKEGEAEREVNGFFRSATGMSRASSTALIAVTDIVLLGLA